MDPEETLADAAGGTPQSDVLDMPLDMPVDPNEPTYCLCHQVSYGEMIGCDNLDVSFEISIKSLSDLIDIKLPLYSVPSNGFTLLVWV